MTVSDLINEYPNVFVTCSNNEATILACGEGENPPESLDCDQLVQKMSQIRGVNHCCADKERGEFYVETIPTNSYGELSAILANVRKVFESYRIDVSTKESFDPYLETGYLEDEKEEAPYARVTVKVRKD